MTALGGDCAPVMATEGRQLQRQSTDATDDSLDGSGWVVVNGATTAHAKRELEPSARLALLKKVWQLRICQRKPSAKIVEQLYDDGLLDEAHVEEFVSEVESFRTRLGVHWTWFEEELRSGKYDSALSRGLVSSGCHLEEEGGDAKDKEASKASGHGRQSRRASASNAKSSSSKAKPRPSQETWMAAKEHRKTNFFAAAVLGTDGMSAFCSRSLLLVLRCTEVAEALSVGMTSKAFASALLRSFRGSSNCGADAAAAPSADAAEATNDLWWALGDTGFAGSRGGARREAVLFANDPAFQPAVWARRRVFTFKVAMGVAQPATVAAVPASVCGSGTELGPLVNDTDAELLQCASWRLPSRLLVGDGRQSFQVLDVQRRKETEVEFDRFSTRRLRASLGAHSTGVTASWPVTLRGHCVLSGGVLVARHIPKNSDPPQDLAGAFQWLELPDFDDEFEPLNLTPAASAAGSPGPTRASSPQLRAAGSPKMAPKRMSSPQLRTSASPKLAPRSPSMVCKSGMAPLSPPPMPFLSSLERISVTPDSIATAAGSAANEGLRTLSVEAVWPLRKQLALLLVRGLPPRHSTGCASKGTCWWLQLWDLKVDTSTALRAEPASPEPLASVDVGKPITAVDVEYATGDAKCIGALILCGLATGGAELRVLPSGAGGRQPLSVLHAWPGEAGGSGPATHVLLRGVPASKGHMAIVAQAAKVVAHPVPDDRGGVPETSVHSSALLPDEGDSAWSKSVASTKTAAAWRAASLQRVGEYGFAVCSDSHVYAFEVSPSGRAVLLCVVDLAAPPEVHVTHFDASPYEFFVTFDQVPLSHPERNALCGLWPCHDQTQQADSGLGRYGRVPLARSLSDCSNGMMLALRTWTSCGTGGRELFECQTTALCLNAALPREFGLAAINNLFFHASTGLLAVAAPDLGVISFAWGVETNAELDRLRTLHKQRLRQEEQQRELEQRRRRYARLRQKVQEMDRLEARAKEGGMECLNEEEQAKLKRRTEVELECERLALELGEDEHDEDCESEESDAGAHEQEEAAHRRRVKEREQKEHAQNKRALQKERQKNRARKFAE